MKLRSILYLVCGLLLVGCGRPGTASLVTIDQVSSPGIPEHPMLQRMVGGWGELFEAEWIIREDETSGEALGYVIEDQPNDVWATVINNVHWEDDALCFDMYSYVVDGSEYSDSHPFNGVAVHMEFRLTDDPNVLAYSSSSEHTDVPFTGELLRID